LNLVFLSESTDYQLNNQELYIDWLLKVSKEEKHKLGEIIYRFVSEERILEINKTYLNHDYYTDIIAFDESFLNVLRGDIYICVDIVKRNSAEISGNDFEKELQRVIVHGLLHLIGYKDRSKDEKALMRKKEDYYLDMLVRR